MRWYDAGTIATTFSAWFAGNGLAVAAFLFPLAASDSYTSQARRPIFQRDGAEPAA